MLPERFREPSPPTASRPHMPGYGILDADSGQGLLPWSCWNMENFNDAIRVVWPVVAYGFSAAVGEFTGSATRWTFPTTELNRIP